LCAGIAVNIFDLKLLDKYSIDYYQCLNCQSLQTEFPFWLSEAYEDNSLSRLDTGAVQRNLNNFAATHLVAKLFGYKNIIDMGGGDGLLCRLLRDYNLNCFVKDKYAKTTYSQGFTSEDFNVADLTLAFEVIEHFENPASNFDELFNYKSAAVLVSTGIYYNQGREWWYLTPESGQHVFFYGRKGLQLIADRYDYTLIISGGFILFIKSISFLKKLAVLLLLKGRVVRLWKAFMIYSNAPGVWGDHVTQVGNIKFKKNR